MRGWAEVTTAMTRWSLGRRRFVASPSRTKPTQAAGIKRRIPAARFVARDVLSQGVPRSAVAAAIEPALFFANFKLSFIFFFFAWCCSSAAWLASSLTLGLGRSADTSILRGADTCSFLHAAPVGGSRVFLFCSALCGLT
jgi:hypothetical protein